MICTRGKFRPRILRLTSRCGAGRSVWAPLVLRWRQRRPAPRHAIADRKTASVPQMSLTRNYFYFVTHASDSGRRLPSLRVFPTTSILRKRVTSDRSRTRSVTIQNTSVNPRSSPQSTFTAVSISRERVFDRPRTSVLTINRTSVPQPAHRISCINYVSRRALPGVIIERTESLTGLQSVFRSTTRIHSRSASVERLISPRTTTRLRKTYSHTHEHQTRIVPIHGPVRASSSQNKYTRIFVHTAEHLVWRTHNETSRRLNSSRVVERSSVGTIVDEAPGQSISPSISRTTPQPITKLDPALVDRLTDDVIRRVEQRARIERQRRGL
jgi:hypothetical protein